MQKLGKNILAEQARFRKVLTGVPNRSGYGRLIEVNGNDSIQGFAPEHPSPSKEEGWFVNLGDGKDSLQVGYSTRYPDGKDPVVVRTLMYQRSDNSDPSNWKLETWHRDTVVRESDGAVLGDQAHHTTTAYPGSGTARNGIVVADEALPELPLSSGQADKLAGWKIAH